MVEHSHQVGEEWYRYDSFGYGEFVGFHLRRLRVVRITNKCVFVTDGYEEKRVIVTARRKYAHPTKEGAQESFRRRKNMQVRILEDQLDTAKKVQALIEKCDKNGWVDNLETPAIDKRYPDWFEYV